MYERSVKSLKWKLFNEWKTDFQQRNVTSWLLHPFGNGRKVELKA